MLLQFSHSFCKKYAGKYDTMIETQADLLSSITQFHQTQTNNWEIARGQTLRWVQTKVLGSDYQLYSQKHVLGSLRYIETRFLRQGIAKTTEGEWHFKYTRFSLPKVTIQRKNDLVAQAVMETNWGWYGTLIFPDNVRFLWKPKDEAENEYCFLNLSGHELVSFYPRYSFLKLEAEVEIHPTALQNPRIPLLTVIGWFLVLLRMR
jgi:hypothetical protein